VPPSQRLGKPVPPAIEAIALRCMAKDPAQRYASAGELAAALEEALGGAPAASVRAVGSRTWPGNPAARDEDSVSEVTSVRAQPVSSSPAPPPGVPFRRPS
jgi:hypothetical protein